MFFFEIVAFFEIEVAGYYGVVFILLSFAYDYNFMVVFIVSMFLFYCLLYLDLDFFKL